MNKLLCVETCTAKSTNGDYSELVCYSDPHCITKSEDIVDGLNCCCQIGFLNFFLLLNFQIDKYIKVADSGTIPENDPMHFKPNLDALDQVEFPQKHDVNQLQWGSE